nr:MAG TPA: hypothetical protein [Bacteriophage sp.]
MERRIIYLYDNHLQRIYNRFVFNDYRKHAV